MADSLEETKPLKKKRGRKPKHKIDQFYSPEKNPKPVIDDTIILHLPIDDDYIMRNMNDKGLVYDPIVRKPEPFDPLHDNIQGTTFYEHEIEKGEDIVDKNTLEFFSSVEAEAETNKIDDDYKKAFDKRNKTTVEKSVYNTQETNDSIDKFSENSDNWPSCTDIHCWWCCHKFNNKPIGLPISYENKYKTVGVFCSFNCALAYNSQNVNLKEVRFNETLLKMLFKDVTGKDKLIKAPPREKLKMFGGHLDITTFRKVNYEIINIFPPMIGLNLHTEDVKDKKKLNKYTPSVSTTTVKIVIPLDENEVTRALENIKNHKKEKINNSKTLEEMMGLTSE